MSEKYLAHEDCFVAPGAKVIGNVKLCEHSSVWYNAVIRGDMAPIVIGCRTNIQDNCTLHCDRDMPLLVGDDVTVGHNAVLHSCSIGEGSLIGMGAILLSGSKVGKNCIVAAGSLVTSSTVMADGTLYMGSPAKFKRNLSNEEIKKNHENALEYVSLVNAYLKESSAKGKLEFVFSQGLCAYKIQKIEDLAKECELYEHICLKLNRNILKNRDDAEKNDILCFNGEKLVGFLEIINNSKESKEAQITGMVAPSFRHSGIFTKMFSMAQEECRKRKIVRILLVTCGGCTKGGLFAQQKGFSKDHTEIALICSKNSWNMKDKIILTFRRAVTRDIKEMIFLDMIGLAISRDEAEKFYENFGREEYYIAEFDSKPVGHICVSKEEDPPLISGLVVSPIYRIRGFGREILDYALDIIFTDGYEKAKIEVDCDNKKALSLYSKAGFCSCDRYDYYKLEKEK